MLRARAHGSPCRADAPHPSGDGRQQRSGEFPPRLHEIPIGLRAAWHSSDPMKKLRALDTAWRLASMLLAGNRPARRQRPKRHRPSLNVAGCSTVGLPEEFGRATHRHAGSTCTASFVGRQAGRDGFGSFQRCSATPRTAGNITLFQPVVQFGSCLRGLRGPVAGIRCPLTGAMSDWEP